MINEFLCFWNQKKGTLHLKLIVKQKLLVSSEKLKITDLKIIQKGANLIKKNNKVGKD